MPHTWQRWFRRATLGSAFLVFLALTGCATSAAPKQKIKIASLNDLPRHAYKIDGSVTDLLKSDAAFAKFAKQVRVDLESDLDTYEIDDAPTLQGMYSTLMSLDLIDGRYDDALKRSDRIRDLETKQAAKLMAGVGTRAYVAAARETHADVSAPAFQAAFQKHLAAEVKNLPWDVIQDEIKTGKGAADIISENYIFGIVKGQMDPVVAKAGEVSADLASNVVRMRYVLTKRLPLMDEMAAVYQQLIDAHPVAKKDIWSERAFDLEPNAKLEPVMIAIWDSGVDVSVFKDQLFTNPNEKVDGADDDGNGYVDDLHGIAYDFNGMKSPELLHPLGDMTGKVEQAMQHMQGFEDVQAALDTPEATALKKYLSTLEPENMRDMHVGLSFCGLYAHGTHVAGIAIAGNPFARVLVSRITFDYHEPPQAVTEEIARRHAQSYHDAVAYFKQHGVRAVNMSWGWTLKEIESALEANNVGGDAAERGALAAKILGILRDGLHDAIAGAPDILFISAAGNEDSDVEFDQTIPSCFELPNLLIVGAVDQAGEPTSFTSMGRNVVVYANGFEVESYIPGGKRMKMSGTSMSSPNVLNLAAKLIALKPELQPTQVIDLIKRGADRKEGKLSYLLMNPKRSAELAGK